MIYVHPAMCVGLAQCMASPVFSLGRPGGDSTPNKCLQLNLCILFPGCRDLCVDMGPAFHEGCIDACDMVCAFLVVGRDSLALCHVFMDCLER